MASQQGFRIRGIRAVSARFKRGHRQLNPEARDQLLHVLDELLTGTLTPGRYLEKLSGYDSLFRPTEQETALGL